MFRKRIVITGATGEIGMALVEKCLQEENEVIVISRPDSGRLDRLRDLKGVQLVLTPLDRLLDAANEIQGSCDVFYHFAWAGTTGAARDDMYLQNQNVRYTLDAVELADRLGCKTFVGAGSQAEYGRVEGLLRPDTPAFPENGYGMAKLCAGQMSCWLCEKKRMRHIWTRILSVYGPYDGPGSLISTVIRKLLAGEHVSLTKGEQLWDYLYAKDAAQALYLLAERGISGKIYCLGGGKARALREYVQIIYEMIAKKTEYSKKTEFSDKNEEERKQKEKTELNDNKDNDKEKPKKSDDTGKGKKNTNYSKELLGFGEIPYGDRQVMQLCADIRELEADTGFTPDTPFEKGIRETIDWWIEEFVKADADQDRPNVL